MKSYWRSVLLLGLFVLCTPHAHADVTLPALISDGMVLQQGTTVPLWGAARDGEVVVVEFQGQKVSATAKGGQWLVRLSPLKPGGPFTLTVSGQNRIELKNVLVGEVWVCSGQSNMAWRVNQSANAETEIANAKYPQIRLFTVPRLEADVPVKTIKGSWKECSPETVATFSAVGYFFGRDLHKARHVPIGLINSSVGGTPAEAWMSEAALKAYSERQQIIEEYEQKLARYNREMETFKIAADKAKAESQPAPNQPSRAWKPVSLYNGMIAPLIPFAIKGVIWYQGEANSPRAYQYRTLFPALIRNWRADWGAGDFPFLFVQLAAVGPQGELDTGRRGWPELREAQLLTMQSVPKTGMAVSIDYGDREVHPIQKEPVGARLTLAARAIAYGEQIVYSGPIYQAMKIEGSKIALSFKHTGSGLETRSGALQGVTIAGEDQVFHPAQAEIKGNQVIVSSAEVTKPVAVRYAWTTYPLCNLYNKEGLPASPFRTDNWPGVTQPRATIGTRLNR